MSGNLIFSNATLGTSKMECVITDKHLYFFHPFRVIVVAIKSYCHNYSLKSILVMKTALFKLLSQAIILRYATNHNIKFQTRLSPPFLNTNFLSL